MDQAPATAIWRRALDEVERLAALDGGARADALAQLQAQSPELHARVLALLADTRSAASFTLPLPAEAPPADLAGQKSLGPCRFVRLLGSGGMGQVWLAERSDGRYEGAVAIKLLMFSGHAGWVERVRREGQLLGRLAHSHIARLLDAGAWQGGQPYLVLEHVDGQRIDHWCDERRLPVEARLALRSHLARERSDTHLNAPALVHAAYLRFADRIPADVASRRVFFQYASRAMQSVVIDQVRQRGARKRGEGVAEVTLGTGVDAAPEVHDAVRVAEVQSAMERLQRVDAGLHEIVHLRCYAGLSIEEVAELLETSPATVKRRWKQATTILRQTLDGS